MDAKVVELADTQDSGSCGGYPRGGSNPPFRTIAYSILFVVLLFSGCNRGVYDQAKQKALYSIETLDKIIKILEKYKGDEGKSYSEIKKYITENKREIAEARVNGYRLLKKLSKDEKVKLQNELRPLLIERLKKIQALINGYENKKRIMLLINEINH